MSKTAAARGLLRISAPLVFGRLHIAPIVTNFLDRHPQVSVELMLSNHIVDLLEEGIDVALRIGHLLDSRLVAKQVGEVRHVLVASREYLAGHGTPKDLSELTDHEIVLQSTSGCGMPEVRLLQAALTLKWP